MQISGRARSALPGILVLVLAVAVSAVHAERVIEPADSYGPVVKPSEFTTEITNPYFSLPVGKKMVFVARTEDDVERIEILIPGWTRNVAGVETLVFWDRVYVDGELIEDTRDYLAQHKPSGDVWYFGEHVDNYEDGILVDHEGAWLAGVDGAKPGIWMLANPRLGDQFRNEFYPGKAEDISTVIAVNETVQVAGRTFTDCVKNLDGSPLFQAKAHTYYCKGQGVSGTVLEVELPGPDTPEQVVDLVEVDLDGAHGVAMPAAYAWEGVVQEMAEMSSTW